jgi:beta-lactamase superfamily II metal-dependent hydrolase
MQIITANVGQGALAIVRHQGEAIIIDSNIPPADNDTVAFMKELLVFALRGHNLKGLILTGFDSDHADVVGVSLILRKYRPDWVMYPTYYKDSQEAQQVFAVINGEVAARSNSSRPLLKKSVRVDNVSSRRLSGLSDNFDFELFSPHIEDMDSSNNSSIVVKIVGRGQRGFSYLVTGDTEIPRWETICKHFGSALKSHVLAAPHHGSRNAVHPASLLAIAPHTVLISAGVDSEYGHPHPQAVKVYKQVAKYVYSTNMEGGVTLLTEPGPTELTTTLIRRATIDREAAAAGVSTST